MRQLHYDETTHSIRTSGGSGGGGGGAVTAADGALVTEGSTADAAYSGTGAGTMVALLKGLFARLRGGQATMANSLPVAISSDQSAVPVSSTDGGQITIGSQADAAYTTGSGTVVSVLKGIFGKVAGTQYADGATAATPTGNAVVWNDVGTARVPSAAKPLPVSTAPLTSALDTVTVVQDSNSTAALTQLSSLTSS